MRWLPSLLLLLAACGSEQTDDIADASCPEGSVLTYENFGGPFLSDWCTGCHSSDVPVGQRQNAPEGVDFDTHGSARQWADRILARAAGDEASMPPVGGPTAEEQRMLAEWIACGAP